MNRQETVIESKISLYFVITYPVRVRHFCPIAIPHFHSFLPIDMSEKIVILSPLPRPRHRQPRTDGDLLSFNSNRASRGRASSDEDS